MRTTNLLALAALASGLAAQSNTVAGLDGRLTVIDDLTYYGRRGAAHPNGEVGMAMLNTMCNPGSVNIPWYAPMQPNHPKFGFLIARVAGDRIEQINEWSYCKHAFLSVNVNGVCGSCQDPGTGALMGLNCSDTYGAGNNASRTYLGPPQEIDPWLGTWNPVGSYFDIGDPSQPGFPAAADGVRSLNQSIFDSVDNRVTVDEIDLTTAGASYFYGLQLIHQGEALAHRGDNNAHRGFNPTWSGSQWSFNNNAATQEYGSILTRWPGAQVEEGHNGADDGRFFVAVKVTALGGGNFHYEYAVQNVDNSRAGGAFRIPIDATATASNFSFGDIDTDASNDWSAARIGNEVVFTAPASGSSTNFVEWNTFYNFGFDADYAPGLSYVKVDEARPGAGAMHVNIVSQVPGGSTLAAWTTFGNGCQGSGYIPPDPCPSLNGAGGVMQPLYSPNEYTYRVTNVGQMVVNSFDIWTVSTGNDVVLPAHIYAVGGAFYPSLTPLASTTITVGATPGFYTATFATPVPVNGVFFIGVDTSSQAVSVSNLAAGSTAIACTRPVGGPTWTIATARAAFTVHCTRPLTYLVPQLDIAGSPVLGTSYDLTLADALPSTLAVCVSGWSNTTYNGGTLPAPLQGAPGCEVLVSPDALDTAVVDALGNSNWTIHVPNAQSLVGVDIYHQWAVLDLAANSLGLVTTSAGHGTVGN